jgi:glycosyltransferase involved in cell wall biosynthesis
MNNKIGIVIPTYYRVDGETSKYLKRALDSVFNQTYQNFKIFLIGDRYEKLEEINEIVSSYDNEKLLFNNLEIAKERDNYTNKYAIWSYGGVNATNVGIDISLSENYDYICHLDHDDFWLNNHLECINKCINETQSEWMCTTSLYVNNRLLPVNNTDLIHSNFLPKSSSLIHSSVCMNFNKIPLRYRDIFKETGSVGLPADADLWERCRDYIIKNGLQSTHINQLTCYHIEEGHYNL